MGTFAAWNVEVVSRWTVTFGLAESRIVRLSHMYEAGEDYNSKSRHFKAALYVSTQRLLDLLNPSLDIR
jgi:hypothetical protein